MMPRKSRQLKSFRISKRKRKTAVSLDLPIFSWLAIQAGLVEKKVRGKLRDARILAPPPRLQGLLMMASMYRVENSIWALQRFNRNHAATSADATKDTNAKLHAKRIANICLIMADRLEDGLNALPGPAKGSALKELMTYYPYFSAICFCELNRRWHLLPSAKKFALLGGLWMLDRMNLPRLHESYLEEICVALHSPPSILSTRYASSLTITKFQVSRAKKWASNVPLRAWAPIIATHSLELPLDFFADGIEEHFSVRGKSKLVHAAAVS